MSAHFPLPAEHAIHVLSSCGDNLDAAREVASTNAKHAPLCEDGIFEYWLAVAESLMPESNPENWS